MPRPRTQLLGQAASLIALLMVAPPRTKGDDAADHFEKAVRPVLVETCVKCHGAKKQAGGLRLDTRDAAIEGGENGPAIVPGQPDQSPLVRAVRHEGDVHMPPKGKLPEPSVRAMADWVRQGAPWPSGPIATADPKAEGWKTHWAFQPIRKVAPPRPQPAGGPHADRRLPAREAGREGARLLGPRRQADPAAGARPST